MILFLSVGQIFLKRQKVKNHNLVTGAKGLIGIAAEYAPGLFMSKIRAFSPVR